MQAERLLELIEKAKSVAQRAKSLVPAFQAARAMVNPVSSVASAATNIGSQVPQAVQQIQSNGLGNWQAQNRQSYGQYAQDVNSGQTKLPLAYDASLGTGKGMVKGMTGYTGVDKYLPVPKYEPYSTLGKVSETAGGLAGFALGPGKLIAPLETAVAARVGIPAVAKSAPIAQKVLNTVQRKVIPAAMAEIASSTPLAVTQSVAENKPLSETIPSNIGMGLAARSGLGLAPVALMGALKAAKNVELPKSLKVPKLPDDLQLPKQLSDPLKGNYLYHGTGETALENITKEGLKPGRHTGNISLSPNESYAKQWSQSGMTPQGKTEGVMLRVNRDLLKTKILPSKSGVKSDQLNEVISKDVIPPESLEIYKNGKWQPLKPTDPLEALKVEARKYKSAEELKLSGLKLYRGTPDLTGDIKVGSRGLSVTTDKTVAEMPYFGGSFMGSRGKVTEFSIKPSAKILTEENIPQDIIKQFKTAKSEVMESNAEKAAVDFAKKNGYDAIDWRWANDNPSGVTKPGYAESEIKIVNPDVLVKSQLTDLYNQSQLPKSIEAPKTNGFDPLGATIEQQNDLLKNVKLGTGKYQVGEIYIQKVNGQPRPIIISRVNADGSVDGFYAGAISQIEQDFGIGRNSLQSAKWKNPAKELQVPVSQSQPTSGQTPDLIRAFGGQSKPVNQISTFDYGVNAKKTAQAFAQSSNQKPIGKYQDNTFSLGDFGLNAYKNKQSLKDRFSVDELPKTIDRIIGVYRASNDPKNWRYDNKAWVAKMPDEIRVVYTRSNKQGQEEIINWHSLNKDLEKKYLETLKSYGVPGGIRTLNSSLEGNRFNPLAYKDSPIINRDTKKVKASPNAK